MENRWDKRYELGDRAQRPPDPLLEVAAAAAQRGDALDVACGTGRHAIWLAKHGWTVMAVDYSKIALQMLADSALGLHIRTIHADIEAGDFLIESGRYTLIVDTAFLHRPLFEQIREGLAPGGVFFGIFAMDGINPAYLINAGELLTYFPGWDILHHFEGQGSDSARSRAELVARKPLRQSEE